MWLRHRRYQVWLLAASGLFAVGVVASVLVASLVSGNAAATARQNLRSSAAATSSTLRLAIQHENDLVVSLRGFIVTQPTASYARLRQWVEVTDAMARYPELTTVGEIAVASSDGKSIGATASPYCFIVRTVVRSGLHLKLPSNKTYCTKSPIASALTTKGSSATPAYLPFPSAIGTLLVVFTPVYRNGVVPATASGRRAGFLAWVATAVEPGMLLNRALQGHSNLAVRLRYHAGSTNVTFNSGPIPHGARSTITNFHNGWTVATFGVVAGSGIFADGNAIAFLFGGILASALLAAFVFVLATGRLRATRLVDEKTEELRHQALHDSLTGMPNRDLVSDRISRLFARGRRSGQMGAALYVDLDHFKNVNDTLGHEAGDQLLCAVAERLATVLRDIDTIGRMGGDEFVVLTEGGELAVGPELVAERLLESLRRPFNLDGVSLPLTITASIGVAFGDREQPGDLLRDADLALYQAKAAGRDCYEVFGPQMESSAQRRVHLEFDLRAALENDQFRLVYQPIYALSDLSLVSVEALLRWDNPLMGEIQPNEFIPLLESSGQIVDVGRWVLHKACKQAALWREQCKSLAISINVSGNQLNRDGLITHIEEALASSGLEPGALTIEVTETVLMRDLYRTRKQLQAIAKLGVQIAIDDFGAGYSSLAYLQQFPANTLKIDRVFTDVINRSSEPGLMIDALVALGRNLGLKIIVEGVETAAQLDYLRTQQVDEVQGFLLSRPLDSDALATKLLDLREIRK